MYDVWRVAFLRRESIRKMRFDLAVGGNGAQVGAYENARPLHPAKDKGDSMVWGPYTTSRLQDLGYKTQDSIMQDIGNRSKCRTQE